jgi:hypothetical protein
MISNVKLDLQLQSIGVVHPLSSYSMIASVTLQLFGSTTHFHQQLSQMQSSNTKIKYSRSDSKIVSINKSSNRTHAFSSSANMPHNLSSGNSYQY